MISKNVVAGTAKKTVEVNAKKSFSLLKIEQKILPGSLPNAGSKISKLEKELFDWMGKDAKIIRNKTGDLVVLSADAKKRIRFDFYNTHGDLPHMHIEIKQNVRWKDASSMHRIYPKD